jgi:Tfp pilus assembly protein PilF
MSSIQKLNKIRFELADKYLKRRNLAGAIEVAWEILEDQPNNKRGIHILTEAREEEQRLSAVV